ncbi:PGF-pre-PGF domain-containing protein [Candidatus Woesearchaeota archaeon]|nr:PGF-pre-PGF domain-containing protein [Candidatus Woesearchaeota archaeon]
MRKIILILLAMIISSISVLGVHMEETTYICSYSLEPNILAEEYDINYMDFNAKFSEDGFIGCPENLVLTYTSEEEHIFSQEELAEGMEFTCTYSVVENVYDIDAEGFVKTFSTDEFYECPIIDLQFMHDQDLTMYSVPQVWASVDPDAVISYDLDKAGIPVTSIEIQLSSSKQMQYENVEAAVAELDYKPKGTADIPSDLNVYGYFLIMVEGVPKEDIGDIDVRFIVPKYFIDGNEAGSVRLYMDSGHQWIPLGTETQEATSSAILYSASTDSPGYFMIAGDDLVTNGADSDNTPVDDGMTDDTTQDNNIAGNGQDSDTSDMTTGNVINDEASNDWTAYWVAGAIVVIAVLIGIYVSMRKS